MQQKHRAVKRFGDYFFEYDAGGTDGEEGAVLDEAAFGGLHLHVVHEGASIAVGILKVVPQTTLSVAGDEDGTMEEVDAGGYGLYGREFGISDMLNSRN